MSDAPLATRVQKPFGSLEALRTAWQQEIANGRLLVPDEPSITVLDPVILDLSLHGRVVASLWAQAVFRVTGESGGLGLEISEIPQETHDLMAELLAAESTENVEQAAPKHDDLNPSDARASGGSDTSQPMALRYKALSGPEKIQVALRGHRDGRLQVMKEGNPQLLKFLLQNPRMTPKEVCTVAGSTGSPLDVLKLIADHPQHSQNEAVRLALVKNPRTPIPLVRKHIDKLPRRHIAQIAKSEHIRAEVQRLARKLVITRRP